MNLYIFIVYYCIIIYCFWLTFFLYSFLFFAISFKSGGVSLIEIAPSFEEAASFVGITAYFRSPSWCIYANPLPFNLFFFFLSFSLTKIFFLYFLTRNEDLLKLYIHLGQVLMFLLHIV